MADPHSIAITEEMAIKYFGTEDPVGKTLQIDKRLDFNVSALIKNSPSNSHLQFDFIIPFTTIKEFGNDIESWNSYAYATYVLLDKNAQLTAVNSKIKNLIIKNDESAIATVSLQPISDIHLNSSHIWGLGGEGEMKYVYIFRGIAIFILLTACFNFMNLTTARSSKRAKEVGLRKVIGAQRNEIIFQFLLESFIISLLSFILSYFAVDLLLPYFNELAQKEILFSLTGNFSLVALIILTVLITGLISGLYPDLYLSGFQPVKVLKGVFKTGKQETQFRRVLVIFQFILTIALIFGALVINRQLNFIRNQTLGFNKDNVISVYLPNNLKSKEGFIKKELERNSGIINISGATAAPNQVRNSSNISEWEGSEPDEQLLIYFLSVDEDYFSLFDLKIKEGRFFSDEITSDESSVVINETAVKVMGMENPIGKQIGRSKIIGVVKDYHFSLYTIRLIHRCFILMLNPLSTYWLNFHRKIFLIL